MTLEFVKSMCRCYLLTRKQAVFRRNLISRNSNLKQYLRNDVQLINTDLPMEENNDANWIYEQLHCSNVSHLALDVRFSNDPCGLFNSIHVSQKHL